MHLAHNIPEIVQIIIDCAHIEDNNTTVACACICRLWSDIALDKIWHTLDGPDDLFVTAMPRAWSPPEEGEPVYHSDPVWCRHVGDTQVRDWDRYFSYARRVRSFNFRPDHTTAKGFVWFVNSCPMKPILPRLEALDLQIFDLHVYPPDICTESLVSLTTKLSSVMTFSVEAAQSIVAVSPDITHVSFFADCTWTIAIENTTLTLLIGLRRLQHVELRFCLLQASLISSISRHTDLHTLALVQHIRDNSSISRIFETESDDIADGFRALSDLRLLSRSTSAVELLHLHRCFRQLKKVAFEFTDALTDGRIVEIISCVRTICHDLVDLSLMQSFSMRDDVSPYTFARDALLPLKGLPGLRSFTFNYALANTMTDEDLVQLVKDCPQLEELWLCPLWPSTTSRYWRAPEVTTFPDTQLTLRVLSLLSHQPNNIRSLRLCIRVDAEHPALARSSDITIGEHLKKVSNIGFGYSFVGIDMGDDEKLRRVGSFLKECLPFGCQLVEGEDGEELVKHRWHGSEKEDFLANQRKWNLVYAMLREC